MATFQRLSCLTSGTAAALLMSWPAHADGISTTPVSMADTVDPTTILLEAEESAIADEASGAAMRHLFASESTVADVTPIAPSNLELEAIANSAPEPETITEADRELTAIAEPVPTAEPIADSVLVTEPLTESTAEAELVADQTLADYLTESSPLAGADFATAVEPASSDAAIADFPATAGAAIAQARPPAARGVAPYYVGVGGNIGIIDSDESAIGDFGFSVISKFSIGPRFALRPTLQFSEDDFSVALPVTYNFNPVDFRRFSVYPAAGVGIDISDGIGLLLNGSVDIPISRDFTLNSQLNWRVTDDAGLGLLFGVGYNFQTFFE